MRLHDMREDEMPRERLLMHGPKTLSNAELLAIVLRQGSKGENVIDLSRRLFGLYDLEKMSRVRCSTLMGIRGIGEAKACQIRAVFELGRRLASVKRGKVKEISCAKDIVKRFMPEMSTLSQEHCVGVYVDSRRRIIRDEVLFVGSLNSAVVHPREIFKMAIHESAAGVIIIHNHPSGDPSPSEKDIDFTRQLALASDFLEIDFVDHVIIGAGTYFSFKEGGYL